MVNVYKWGIKYTKVERKRNWRSVIDAITFLVMIPALRWYGYRRAGLYRYGGERPGASVTFIKEIVRNYERSKLVV